MASTNLYYLFTTVLKVGSLYYIISVGNEWLKWIAATIKPETSSIQDWGPLPWMDGLVDKSTCCESKRIWGQSPNAHVKAWAFLTICVSSPNIRRIETDCSWDSSDLTFSLGETGSSHSGRDSVSKEWSAKKQKTPRILLRPCTHTYSVHTSHTHKPTKTRTVMVTATFSVPSVLSQTQGKPFSLATAYSRVSVYIILS